MSQVILYYWASASSIRKIDKLSFVTGPSFGHVALAIIPDEEMPENYEYISFWPGNCQNNNHTIEDAYICRVNTPHFHTRNQDDYIYQDRLPKIVILTSLDDDVMIESYHKFRQRHFEWSVFGSTPLASDSRKNCVGLSHAILNEGGFKSLSETYYHWGILTGAISTIIPLFIMETIKYTVKFFLMFLHGDDFVEKNLEQLQNLLIFDSLLIYSSALIGVTLNLNNFSVVNYLNEHKRIGFGNLIGAIFGTIAVSFAYYKLYFPKKECSIIGEMILIERLISMLSSFRAIVWLSPFVVLLSGVLGAVLGSKLLTLDISSPSLNPGYFSGMSATLLSSLLTEGIRVGADFFCDTFLKSSHIKLTPHNLYISDIRLSDAIGYIGISALSTILSGYFVRKSINYIVNESIVTPYKLHEMTFYAKKIEELNKKTTKTQETTLKMIKNNKKNLFIVGCSLAVIGIFAFNNKERVGSIFNNFKLSEIFSLSL